MCGAQLAPAAPAVEVRKTVTIVFSDLKGSTSLGEQLDSESLREVLNEYFNEMRSVLERHGGTVEKYIGDAIMAVFGLPQLHEDDALRAVRAAAEMKETLVRVNERLRLTHGVTLENRTGVNTGEVVAGDVSSGQRLVTGDTVNVAARLEQNAPATEVLLGAPTYRLVRDAVEVEAVEPLSLKGKSEPMPAYRLVSVVHDEGVARRLDSPLVGREHELSVLTEALAKARSHQECAVVTVVGPAGAGKSRLLREFVARSAGFATSLRGHCLSYGDGITFWPLAEITREAAQIGDDDPLEVAMAKLGALLPEGTDGVAERVAAAMGLSDETFSLDEMFWAARRLIEILARDRALIVVIDDIHWAEQTFLDLIRYLAGAIRDVPVVLACSSRPELLHEHEDWATTPPTDTMVILPPLSSDESSRVVANLLGSSAIDSAARERIIEAAEGNPLFVEQMLSMLIDDGMVAQDASGSWVVLSDLGSITIPPTIAALLTARLDRLGPSERAAIERGAVVGQVFFRGAVAELLPDEARDGIDESLSRLVRKEMISTHESSFAGQEAFKFLHGLIRDAAYGGLLKRTRAELHERFVDWLERIASDRVLEFEEIRGYHLEQAHQILTELGLPDDHVKALGARGARYLASAGRRALARRDMPAAAKLLARAALLLPADDPQRPMLRVQAGDAMIEAGQLTEADETLELATAEAAELGDRATEISGSLVHLRLRFIRDPESIEGQLFPEAERYIEELQPLEHDYGLAQAWDLIQYVHWTSGRYGAAEEAARRAIDHSREAGELMPGRQSLGSIAISTLYGPTPVPRAIELSEELLVQAGSDRKAQALIKCALGHLESMRGDFEHARALYRESRGLLEELGLNLLAALTSLSSSEIERLAGDPVAAEAELRQDLEALRAIGDKVYLPTTAVMLANILYEQSRFDEAERFVEMSEQMAAKDDVTSQSLINSVRARLSLRQGLDAEAVSLATEAVRLIEGSDDLEAQANALMDMAYVQRAVGHVAEAAETVGRAITLFEQKGDAVSARRARNLLKEISTADDRGPIRAG